MKLEHLLECYRYKGIHYQNIDKESYVASDHKTLIIHFNKHVKAVCCSDSEIVHNIRVVADWNKDISNYTRHTLNVLHVIQASIDCLSNISQNEINIILRSLGLYDGSFVKGKEIKNDENLYKIEVINGVLMFTIAKL